MRKSILFRRSLLYPGLFLILFFSGRAIHKNRCSWIDRLREEYTAFSSSVEPGVNMCFLVKQLKFPRVELGFGRDVSLPAASLIKLPLIAVVFQADRDGFITLDQEIVINKQDVAGGSGKIKKMSLPARMDIKELCYFSISYSDNTATNKLIDLLGFDYINRGFRELNLKGTVLKRKMMDFSRRDRGIENYTSAGDITRLLEDIYLGRLVDRKASFSILSFLRKQTVNDRIPRFLPGDSIAAHKTGLEKGIVHDAGIVFSPEGDYIICVLTKGFKSYRKAKRAIAHTSLLAYNLYVN